ncbi:MULTISPECIES: YceI family protein [unclassified Streptomyces]|uniref:YceI family protein n=1 Tax=unclassified Streptomyces TaxID=2593676 RepID=UPI001314D649|nr:MULTISPECIES: YceI family protein [unclassified Streptomyces]
MDDDLAIRDVTKQVTLTLEPRGFGANGGKQASFSATAAIVCTDYGVTRGKSAFAVSGVPVVFAEKTTLSRAAAPDLG